MTNQEILGNAPDGATHYSNIEQTYFVMGVTFGWQAWCDVGSKWVEDILPYDISSLSDIKRIVELENDIVDYGNMLKDCFGKKTNASGRLPFG